MSNPPHPFTAIWTAEEDIDEYGLKLSFRDEEGKSALSLPYKRELPPLP